MSPIPPNKIKEEALPRPVPHPEFPSPLLRLHFNDISAPASRTFLENLDVTTVLHNAVQTVLSILYPRVFTPAADVSNSSVSPSPSTEPERTNGAPQTSSDPITSSTPMQNTHTPPWPGTRSITLIIDPHTSGVAETGGISIDSDHKRIGFALSYIDYVHKNKEQVGRELEGVIVHEMVHCWQWDGKGEGNGGLIEGVADWVRLRAKLDPPHWKARSGKDDTWDSGYAVTAYFLEWLESKFGAGAVMRINRALREGYEEETFWKKLFGVDVGELWTEYCDGPGKWEKKEDSKQEEGASEEQVMIEKLQKRAEELGKREGNEAWTEAVESKEQIWELQRRFENLGEQGSESTRNGLKEQGEALRESFKQAEKKQGGAKRVGASAAEAKASTQDVHSRAVNGHPDDTKAGKADESVD